MADIKPPDDSLSSYFDDLLGDAMSQDSLEPAVVLAAPIASLNSSLAAKVVTLPKKHINKQIEGHYGSARRSASGHTAEPKTRAGRSYRSESQSFGDPELVQTQEQKQQLEKLLQSARTQLLVDATPIELKVAEIVKTEAAVEVVNELLAQPEEIQEWVIESDFDKTDVVADVASMPITESELGYSGATQTDVETTHYQIEGVDWLANGRPQWAQARFDVLLFKVSGLTLAVPLIALGQIRPITEELTPLFGQADWFMGFQLTNTGKISTVNTAKFVMPERYDDAFVKTAKYVVSINGVPWGLAVDSVNQPISLNPEDVKWRTDRSKRPWLAGTVKDHMCALLDIPRIGQLLIDADKNFNF